MNASYERGPVRAEPIAWVDEAESSLTVGWGGYAEYVVRADPGFVDVTVTVAGVDLPEAALCLAITVLPMSLPLLRLEPLHGSAVLTPGGALLVLGASGWGKSSLGSVLARTFPVLTDDACALDASGVLWPGPPLVSLRDAALTASFPGDAVGSYNDKHVMTPWSWSPEPVRVAAIVALDPREDAGLETRQVTGAEALSMVLGNVRSPTVLLAYRRALQLRCASVVTSTAPVAVLTYAPGRHGVTETVESLLAWFGSLVGC